MAAPGDDRTTVALYPKISRREASPEQNRALRHEAALGLPKNELLLGLACPRMRRYAIGESFIWSICVPDVARRRFWPDDFGA